MNHNFPTLCVDNFYKDPDKIREFALSLDYNSPDNNTGEYPGKRTKSLDLVNVAFYKKFCDKLFSLYYDFLTPVEWEITTSFQLICPLSDNPLNSKNVGWIHSDVATVFAGVIYLTPDIKQNCGTSIFKLISREDISVEKYTHFNNVKKKLYLNNIDDGHEEALKDNNSDFVETINFSNVYNRLISFDGNCYHGANNFYSNSEPRLTQVFFVRSVKSFSGSPLQRCYRSEL
jgi:hypothetical protein